MRISPEVEIAFSLATREAARRRHEFVTVEHLLYALLFDDETAQILRHSGADAGGLKKKLEGFLDEEIAPLPETAENSPSLSLGFQRVVGRAAGHGLEYRLAFWEVSVRLGMFSMPLHPPGRPIADTYEDDLRTFELADRLGYDEIWIGEHFTSVWENIPAPDLFIAQAAARTRRQVRPGHQERHRGRVVHALVGQLGQRGQLLQRR